MNLLYFVFISSLALLVNVCFVFVIVSAQCAHAAVGSYRNAEKKDSALLNTWLACGQPKIAVQIHSDNEMYEEILNSTGYN